MAESRDWDGDTERLAPVLPVAHAGRAVARRGGRLCLACGARRPLFSYRGVVRADRHHTLCFACFRAESNRLRAWVPGDVALPLVMAMPRPAPAKTVTDRGAVLADIAVRRRRALIQARRALDAPVPVVEPRALAS